MATTGQNLRRALWTAAAVLVTVAAGTDAWGQSRKEVGISAPGSFHSVGDSARSGAFVSNSYGLGAVGGITPGGNILSSSIYQGGNFNIQRGGGGIGAVDFSGQGALPAMPGMPSGPMKLNTPALMGLPAMDSGGGGLAKQLSSSTLMSAMDYLGAVNPDALKNKREPITTLVPTEPGMYHDFLEKGERALHNNDFYNACNYFQYANDIAGHDPESLLSMAHARLGMSDFNSSAYYLRRAIKYLPELPLAPMKVKGFFGDPAIYSERVIALEQKADLSRGIPGLHLLLAYLRWYEDDLAAAQSQMRKAMTDARDPEEIEAIQTFWDGMVASGKVSGKLEPATQPASALPASTPAAGPEKAPTATVTGSIGSGAAAATAPAATSPPTTQTSGR